MDPWNDPRVADPIHLATSQKPYDNLGLVKKTLALDGPWWSVAGGGPNRSLSFFVGRGGRDATIWTPKSTIQGPIRGPPPGENARTHQTL